MRKAPIVDFDHYVHVGLPSGCGNGAQLVKSVLEHHAHGTINFAP